MSSEIINKLEKYCKDNHIKITEQRKIITEVIANSNDHPDVEKLYERAKKLDSHISIATTYRTIKLLEEAKIIERHDFRDGKSRYELITDEHHDHLVNIKTGKIIEFYDKELEQLKLQIVEKLGYKLIDHRLELYVVPKSKTSTNPES